MSPFACSITWTFYVAFIQNRSTHLCPISTCPFSLRRQTCLLSWGHTLAPGSPLPVPGLQCCPLSPQPFQTLPISQGLSNLPPPPAPTLRLLWLLAFPISPTLTGTLPPSAQVRLIALEMVTARGWDICFSFSFSPVVHSMKQLWFSN